MHETSEIIDFLIDLSGTRKIKPETDIYWDLGMVGDDFHEMIEKFSKKYSVDMNGYLWYFHGDDEGIDLIRGYLIPPPYARVKRIPVTPLMLTQFANQQKWDIEYPEHNIPEGRPDLPDRRDFIILILFLLAISILVGITK